MRAITQSLPGSLRGAGVAGLLPLLIPVLTISLACESRSPFRIRPGPVIQHQLQSGLTQAALRKIAVIPFHPAEQLRGPVSTGPNQAIEATGWVSAALVGRFVTEALAARGYGVIPPSDVEIAFEGERLPVPRLDPLASAKLAERAFGASSVLLGRVMRYREREGSAAGSTRPTSVAFEVALHEVPGGRRLWSGRFDETQQSITANVFRAGKYPGSGTRWLTASEFARWGAGEIAQAMTPPPTPKPSP